MLGPVLYIVGLLLLFFGAAMLVPMLADAVEGHREWRGFLHASIVTIFVGLGLVVANRGGDRRLTVGQTFIFTNLAWLACCLCGALPLALSAPHLGYVDAFFEATSGLTTTGATVIVGLDDLPPGTLLWRALLNWIGGVGIVVMAIVILPFLRIGGMQLFRTESSDKSDKLFGSARRFAGVIALTYLALSLLSTTLFALAGMNLFDAICHAMAAVSTGGFSTKDASLGFFNSHWVNWAATVSMLSGALPLTWYIRVAQNPAQSLWTDSQVKSLLAILAVSISAVALWAWVKTDLSAFAALTHAATNVTSIVSDCGLVSIDYNQWGGFAHAAFFCFYFVGGCTGSTSGSIKVFRWQVLVGALRIQLLRQRTPRRVVVQMFNGRRVAPDVVEAVATFFCAFILTFGLFTVAVAATGADFITSASGVASAMAGAGPGLGSVIGPAGTYQPLTDAAKLLLALAMLLGRLELLTVYTLLLPSFWKEL